MSDVICARSDVEGTALLTVDGVLDSSSYRSVRDSIIKTALDEPRAVIVDITSLSVPAESALAVFTSARWHMVRWPDVPLLLICATEGGQDMLGRNGITRYVPVYADFAQALDALARRPVPGRRRMRTELYPEWASPGLARDLVMQWMEGWPQEELLPVAVIVVSALVENAVEHAGGATELRLEARGDEVTVAVGDRSAVPPCIKEQALGCDGVSGLQIVDAVSRAWGTSPTATGKVVWCVIGPETRS